MGYSGFLGVLWEFEIVSIPGQYFFQGVFESNLTIHGSVSASYIIIVL